MAPSEKVIVETDLVDGFVQTITRSQEKKCLVFCIYIVARKIPWKIGWCLDEGVGTREIVRKHANPKQVLERTSYPPTGAMFVYGRVVAFWQSRWK